MLTGRTRSHKKLIEERAHTRHWYYWCRPWAA